MQLYFHETMPARFKCESVRSNGLCIYGQDINRITCINIRKLFLLIS